MNSSSEAYTEKGSSYEECVSKIREKYGRNYNIIGRREVSSGGFFGIGKKNFMEITYTLTDMNAYQESREQLSFGADRTPMSEKEKILAKAKEASLEKQREQMNSIQKQLELMNDKLSNLSTEADVSPTIRKIEEMLEDNEFTPSYIRKMTDRLRSEFSIDALEDFDSVQNRVVEWIGQDITIDSSIDLEKRPTVLILVGPTGVGKTTTVAKLAARFKLGYKNLFLRMVSIDRFRIAAQEQLETYGKHLEIPTTSAETDEDIQKLLSIDGGRLDLMLIDTIGYSPHDYESLGKMRKILEVSGAKPEVFLVFSASTKASDIKDIMRNYEPFDYKAVIVTKYDETNHIGNVVSILSEKNKPVAFISAGQRVPRDMENATVIRFLMKLTDFKIDRESLENKFSALPTEMAVAKNENNNGSEL